MKYLLIILLIIPFVNLSAQKQEIDANLQVNGRWNSNFESGIIIGRSGWQEGNTLGNRYVPVGARSGTLYLDFSGFRDRVQYQVGARIAGERYNIYEGENANGALVQSTELVFYTNSLRGWTTETVGLEERMRITYDGKIGIKTSKPLCDLDVRGKIMAEEVEVKVNTGADHVFYPGYALKPLSEVESFVKENKHLPDIPSEKQMVEEGLNVNEMQIKLLQKIEELTLYMIEQDKKIEKQDKQNKDLQKQVNELKVQLNDNQP